MENKEYTNIDMIERLSETLGNPANKEVGL
jgi:hypothetical protein